MDTIRDLVILPFTSGTPRKINNVNSHYQDGTTATFVWLLFALSFIFVFVENPNSSSYKLFNSEVILAVLGLIFVSGMIACIITGINSYQYGIHSLTVKTSKSTHLQEYCLWLLGVPSMAFYE